MVDKKAAAPAKSLLVQAPTTTSGKKVAAPAKDLAAQAPITTTATATTPFKKPPPNTSSPGSGATSRTPPIKAPVALRPKPLGGDEIKSSPKNPAWEPHLSLKQAGFRVPIFRPRDT